MQRDPRAYLWDAVKAAEAVRTFTLGRTYEAFVADDMLRAAVERQLEIVGEALAQFAKIDSQSAAKIPDLRRIVAFRNILVHGYAGIDYTTVRRLIQDKLPELVLRLKALQADEDAPPGREGGW
jgi:uncharacterized protein with HEPN domain